jgi:DNA-3-methyladenine glycosylase II
MAAELPAGGLSCEAILARHLQSLLLLDPRLSKVYDMAGPFSPRIGQPGLQAIRASGRGPPKFT